jgi:hypothetical protein
LMEATIGQITGSIERQRGDGRFSERTARRDALNHKPRECREMPQRKNSEPPANGRLFAIGASF